MKQQMAMGFKSMFQNDRNQFEAVQAYEDDEEVLERMMQSITDEQRQYILLYFIKSIANDRYDEMRNQLKTVQSDIVKGKLSQQ